MRMTVEENIYEINHAMNDKTRNGKFISSIKMEQIMPERRSSHRNKQKMNNNNKMSTTSNNE